MSSIPLTELRSHRVKPIGLPKVQMTFQASRAEKLTPTANVNDVTTTSNASDFTTLGLTYVSDIFVYALTCDRLLSMPSWTEEP